MEKRAPCWRQVPTGGDEHGQEGESDVDDDALHRDPPGATGDDHGFAESIQSVDGEHDVSRLRRRGRAPRPDGPADVGEGECGCVVEAVAHHDRGTGALFERYRRDFVGGAALGEDVIDSRPPATNHVPRHR